MKESGAEFFARVMITILIIILAHFAGRIF